MARFNRPCGSKRPCGSEKPCGFKKRSASALIVVLAMTTVISVITIGWWHRASLSFDIVVARDCYYNNFYLTDRVLSFGIAVAKKRFSEKFSCIEVDCSGIDTKHARATCLITRLAKKRNDSAAQNSLRLLATLYRRGTGKPGTDESGTGKPGSPVEGEVCCRLCCTLCRTSVLRKKPLGAADSSGTDSSGTDVFGQFYVESSFVVTNYTII